MISKCSQGESNKPAESLRVSTLQNKVAQIPAHFLDDLQEIIGAWPDLAEGVKAGILQTVQRAKGT